MSLDKTSVMLKIGLGSTSLVLNTDDKVKVRKLQCEVCRQPLKQLKMRVGIGKLSVLVA